MLSKYHLSSSLVKLSIFSVSLSSDKPSPMVLVSFSFSISISYHLHFLPLHTHSLILSKHQRSYSSRRHNSYTILEQPHNPTQLQEDVKDEQEEIRRKISDEYSLATRRVAKFPGAVDFPKPDMPQIDLHSALKSSVDQDRVLKRALMVRRGVATETLKASLRSAKLSITYSNNLVSRLEDFIDRIVIGAAKLKQDPDFAHQTFNARAKEFIQISGMVPLVKWLKHNSLTYPQIGKIICMCTQDLSQIRTMCEWLKTIFVKTEFLGQVLIKAGPGLLDRTFEELESTVGLLESRGVRKEWIGFVIGKCPKILVMKDEELEARIGFYMDYLGLNDRDFGTMVFDYPKALGFFSLEEMNSKVEYYMQFGATERELGKLIAYKPQIIGCSIEQKLKPLVKYLYYLGVDKEGMKRILFVKPMVFLLDLEKCIVPKVRFLQEIGVRDDAIGSVLVRFPAFLTYSLLKKIRPVVIYLITNAGVKQQDIGKVIALDPQLVGCNILRKLDVNVKYFLSLGIRLHFLGQMVADFPMILRYNLEVLRPKYKYLRRVMIRPVKDLIEFPRFFSYSLEGRIQPRHEILVRNRVNFKLRYILACSDEEFYQKVQEAVQKRKRFEAGLSNSEISTDEQAQNMLTSS